MHSGFAALRSQWPMNISANLVGKGWNVAVQKDLDRLVQMWRSALKDHPGPFLFGPFGAVDAFFAPVMARFVTYGAELPPDIATYRDAILGCEGMRSWIAAAHQETAYLADDEPYRLPEGS
jgi:glutathione S-transferase